MGRALDASDIPLLREGEQLLDLSQCKSETLCAPDEAQAGKLKVTVAAIAGCESRSGCEERVALVVANGIDVHPGPFGKCTNPHGFHKHLIKNASRV